MICKFFFVALGNNEDLDNAVSNGFNWSFAVSSPIAILRAKTLLLSLPSCFMIDERNAFKRESKCGDSQFKSSFKSNRKLGLTAFDVRLCP